MTFVLPSGFIPNEDQGMIYVDVEAPPGATLERNETALNKVQATLLPLDEIENISTLARYSLMTETEDAPVTVSSNHRTNENILFLS